ncbi:hypothetical protein cypCar_00020581 [Cyprinus carpio]|nr:hypothetical protein cypCar_00020581 [Cyprinus carpio]
MDSFYKVLSPEEQALAASNDYNFDHPGAFDFELLKNVYGARVIIFEGILSFADKELLQLMDKKIFVDTDSYIRLVRQLRRDITERGCDIEGGGNMVAIDLIVQHVHSQLEELYVSSLSYARTHRALLAMAHQSQPLPQSLSVLESTPQVRGLHTIIR